MFCLNKKIINGNRYQNGKRCFSILISVFLFFPYNVSSRNSDSFLNTDFKISKQKAFEQVFGDAVRLDTVLLEKVKNDISGKRHYVDKNKDGKPEEVWFIDNDRRHSKDKFPIVVRAIDENGNLEMNKEPDRHGDLWVADWNADGFVDAVIGYEDLDGDGDVDSMGMFFYDPKNGLRVWWSRDDGDDNLLWYDVDYMYDQNSCQYKTHFGGDESFSSFYYSPDKNMWVPFSENPFLFYDRNNDGVTEEVIRIAGHGDNIWSARWSFDADNNGTLEQPRNYDTGITVLAPEWTPTNSSATLKLTGNESEIITIRGIPSSMILDRKKATGYLSRITWGRVLLTWDEIDINRAWNNPNDTIDRWEGVIAAASQDSIFYMPRVGGPDCGPYNKRYELVLQPSAANEFYFNPADYRIHIKYADKAWIDVDYDGDNKSDMYYNWLDTDNDGILDKMTLDIGHNGVIDDSWDIDISGINPVSWSFNEVNQLYEKVVADMPAQKYLLSKSLIAALKSIDNNVEDDLVWTMLQQNMKIGKFSDEISQKLKESSESTLFYLNIICDRQIITLKKLNAGSNSFWNTFTDARKKNDVASMIETICKEFGIDKPEQDYDEWNNNRKDKTQKHVAWTESPATNWRWESENAAFRFYDGHFDLFGKRSNQLIFPDFAKITTENYHYDRNDWGMDILEIGNSSGCGGLILYVDGKAYPVRVEPNQKHPTFTGRLVEETNDRVTLEFVAEEIVPGKPYKVKIRPSCFTHRDDSQIEVIVEGASSEENIEIGLGLTSLPEENFIFDRDKGVMGNWGIQKPEIGWIGMGVIFPTDRYARLEKRPTEYVVVLKYNIGDKLVYNTQSRWLKGLRFNSCPTDRDWADTLQSKAARLNLN